MVLEGSRWIVFIVGSSFPVPPRGRTLEGTHTVKLEER
jgi:hypothetical protein